MTIPDPSDTAFFRKFGPWNDPEASAFILASEADARRRAEQGAPVIGVVRARGIPGRMPCVVAYGPLPAETVIVMMDLCLATWGGAMKAAGRASLFRGAVAENFWALVAHVDAFGVAHLSGWRCQAERAGSPQGTLETAETVLLYRAAVAWWTIRHPTWHGERELPVTAIVVDFARILTVLLGTEADLRAYAAFLHERLRSMPDAGTREQEITSTVTQLARERQELLSKGLEWPLPFQEEEGSKYFLKTIEDRSQAMTGDTTRVYRRR